MSLSASITTPVYNFYNGGLPYMAPNVRVGDNFHRTTLNPTNSIAQYTVALNGTGGGSGVIGTSKDRLLMTTDATAIGDDVTVRQTAYPIYRLQDITTTIPPIDNATILESNFVFRLGNVANVESFVGVLRTDVTTPTTLPGAVEQYGLSFDDSASNNFFFVANGVSTDTTIAATNGSYRLNCRQTSTTTVALTLYTTSTAAVLASASVAISGNNWDPFFIVQNEAAEAETLTLVYWDAIRY